MSLGFFFLLRLRHVRGRPARTVELRNGILGLAGRIRRVRVSGSETDREVRAPQSILIRDPSATAIHARACADTPNKNTPL